jgi:murein L,D-transpeptidase YafK
MSHLLGAVALALLVSSASPDVHAGGAFAKQQLRYPRVKAAAAERMAIVEASFRDAGAAWPPAGVYLRGFKTEGVVELWAASEPGQAWVKVRDFEICASSGTLGPKRRQGDLQVPEGFYSVSRFNPRSSYHLSLAVSYPNAADRFHSRGVAPGSAIMVHGSCVTVGCLPLEDGPIEDLYLAAMMARDAGQETIPIHLFPCRLDQDRCQSTLATLAKQRPELASFWAGLRPGYDAFTRAGAPPVVRARRDGTYAVVEPRPRPRS